MRRTLAIAIAGLVLGLVLGGPRPAAADSIVDLPDPDYAHGAVTPQTDPLDRRIREIVYPTLGAPSFCERGDSLEVRVVLANGGGTTDWRVVLEPTVAPASRTHDLPVAGTTWEPALGQYVLEVPVPADLPRDTYDLTVESADLPRSEDSQPQAVRVVRNVPNRWRFAHIADAQLQDPTTVLPQVLPILFEELRLLDPAFVLYSGDWNFGANYQREYSDNYDHYEGLGLPLFTAPGNHDGYATTVPTGISPPDDPPGYLKRDGWNHWRSMLGPLNYSFEVGGVHFVSLNTFGGGPKRRNSVGFVIANYGGQVDPGVLRWLEQDLADATARGRNIVIFAHHNWRHSVSPNRDSYPNPFVPPVLSNWNDQASADELERLVADYNVTHVLLGHVHEDDYEEVVVNQGTPDERTVRYITTTTVANGLTNSLGYRIVEVENGELVSWDYKPVVQGRPNSGQGSWPLDLTGNFRVDFQDPNDGTQQRVRYRIDSYAEAATPLTVDVWMDDAPHGYVAAGGTIDQVAEADPHGAIVTVRTDLLPWSGSNVVVSAAQQGQGGVGVGYPTGTGGTTAPGSTGGSTSSSSGGPFSCAATGGPRSSRGLLGALLPLLAFLAFFLLMRFRRTSG